MCVFDQAQQREQEDRMRAIAAAAGGRRLVAGGACHNCLEPVSPGSVFCDADCRDDYELRRKAAERNGLAGVVA